ncbi:hypothetical protein MMC12_003512 [Toensbergia leucococca]|nr:hypothetical protein [Toensbergia leucococca]
MADSGLRTRNATSSNKPTRAPQKTQPDHNDPAPKSPFRPSALDILRILGGLFLLSCTLSYFITNDSLFWGRRPAFTRPARIRAWFRGSLFLTDDQLALYNGTDSTLPIYLGINGSIYDVSASPHLYGPGGSYHFFAGREATRAFVTGCFEEDLTPDLRGVEEMFVPVGPDEVEGESGAERKIRRERERRVARGKVKETVGGWERMFDGGKGGKYFWVGRVRREVGWEGRLERRELCEKARKGRPKRGKSDA